MALGEVIGGCGRVGQGILIYMMGLRCLDWIHGRIGIAWSWG